MGGMHWHAGSRLTSLGGTYGMLDPEEREERIDD
jgi:hypothetical protein